MKIKLTLIVLTNLLCINNAFSNTDLNQAYSYFEDEEYHNALVLYSNSKGFSARMGEGNSAYRLNDYEHAIKQYTLALLKATNNSDKFNTLFNLANSYYKNEEYIKAIETYKYVLIYSPESEKAQGNLWSAQSMLIDKIKSNKLYSDKQSLNYQQQDILNPEKMLDEDLKIDDSEKLGYLRTLIGDRVAEGELIAIAKNDDSVNKLVLRARQIRNYLSAVKKLEFVNDNPQSILKSIIDFEKSRVVK